MTTVDILGSCVTRDAFALVNNEYKLNPYFPRSSLISIYSPPIKIKKEGILLDSEYQQRLVYWDMTKEFFNYVKETQSDVLIIDFMDERLGALKINDTYITNSQELKISNIKKLLVTQPLEINEDYMEMWELAALKFIHDVKKRPYKKIIIHKAFYMNSYVDEYGKKYPFENPATLEKIKARNLMLTRMYNFIEINLPGSQVIEPVGYSADKKHKWGLSPFHYELNYYKFFIEALYKYTS